MADQEHNGTEPATPRRREEARREGQVVYSNDLTAAIALLAGTGILLWSGPEILRRMLDGFRVWILDVPSEDWGAWHTTSGAHWLSSELAGSCGMFVGMLAAVSLLFGLLQSGFNVTLKPLVIDWSRLLPSRGWSRVFSAESGVRGLLSAAKVVGLMALTITMIWMRRNEIAGHGFSTVHSAAATAWRLAMAVCLAMAGVTLGLALIDYLARWLRNEQKLQMTREEIKQEQKDDNGDPRIRSAQRQRFADARRRQSVRDVPKATLILTNPTHLAVAIQYESGAMAAPRVVAKGAGVFAKNIVRIARDHEIPVMERKPLARALYAAVDVGQEIPTEFFRAVAEIIAEIYRAQRAA